MTSEKSFSLRYQLCPGAHSTLCADWLSRFSPWLHLFLSPYFKSRWQRPFSQVYFLAATISIFSSFFSTIRKNRSRALLEKQKQSSFPKSLHSFPLQMGTPGSHSAHYFCRGGKGRHCVFRPMTSHPCVYRRTSQKHNCHFLSKWVESVNQNFQPFFSFFQIKEHSILPAPLWWKRCCGLTSVSLCGREAQGDTETDRDGPELAYFFVNSMTMKSKLS